MQKHRLLPITLSILFTFELLAGIPGVQADNNNPFNNPFNNPSNNPPPNEIVVNAYNVRIRGGAGTDYPVIGQADYGARYSVISQDQGWFEIPLSDGSNGWVAGWLTDNNSNPAQTTTTQTANALEKNTNIRSGPSTTYDVIATIDPGTSYVVSQISGDWVQIRLPNERTGWVAKWVVSISNQNLQKMANSEQTQATITGTDVRMRATPNLQGKVLAYLQSGTIVQVVQRQNDWTQIQDNQQTGWVSSGFVQTTNEQLPILSGPVTVSSGQSQNGTVKPNQTGINIRSGPSLNDVVLGTADPNTVYPVVDQSGKWWKIKLQSGKTGWIASWVVQANQVNATTQPPAANTSIDQLLRGKTIVIDPGHGGIDVGAIGQGTGLFEKDMALSTAKILYNKLQATGARVIMTRTDDTFVSLQQRVVDSTQARADAFISIHENTNSDPNIAGTITYFYNAKGEDAKLAEDIEQSIDGGIAHPDLGTQFGDYYVLRENPQLAVLVESAFLSNAADELLAESPDFQERIADGILKGIISYFQNKSGQPTEAKSTNPSLS